MPTIELEPTPLCTVQFKSKKWFEELGSVAMFFETTLLFHEERRSNVLQKPFNIDCSLIPHNVMLSRATSDAVRV